MWNDGFLKDFFPPTEVSIGLDIGHFNVKAIQIKRSARGKKEILSFGIAQITGEDRENIIKAIKQAYRELNTETKKVNISVAGPEVVTRYIIMPEMKESDLYKSIDLELEKYIPHKKEEMNVDYRVVSRLPNKQSVVLLVAVKRKFIQERIDLVKDAGLEVISMNVDALSLLSAGAAFKKTIAVVDVGHRLSKLLVMENGFPLFSRDIEVGLYDIVQMVCAKMDLDPETAKQWCCNPQYKNKETAETIKKDLNNLLSELSLSFEYCERNLDKKITQLYLTGGGAKFNFLLDVLEKKPDLKINIFEPVNDFEINPLLNTARLKEFSPFLSVAIGLI